MIVMKFGGNSLSTGDKILRCIELVRREIDRHPIVVVSACGKTTNSLLVAAREALQGEVNIDPIEIFHRGLMEDLGLEFELLEPLMEDLSALLMGVSLTKELTSRTRDLTMSFGERLSTRVVAAAMSKEGIEASAVNAFEIGLVTTGDHGCATPLPEAEKKIAESLRGITKLPVVTGFLGVDCKGAITTLGRNGSDYSASIIAAAVDAPEVQIWTDVNGVMTCDPSLDDSAQSLSLLSYEEAGELAYYGAQVLHQNTLVPAMSKGIPVRVLNTNNPMDPGTLIVSNPEMTTRIAKSVVYKENVCLINLASPRLTSAVELLSLSLDILRAAGVGIHMATTSEATVSLITTGGYDHELLAAALEDLRGIARVEAEPKKAIICVVGEELKGKVGVLGKIFGAVSSNGIKAKMVSQSASEINVAFLVDNVELESAVRALHEIVLA